MRLKKISFLLVNLDKGIIVLSKNILKAIDKVDSQKEFNKLMEVFKMSDASSDIKEEAIRVLKIKKNVFFIGEKSDHSEVYKEILAGQADIDDLKG